MTLSPEFLSFLTIYAGFLCIACGGAFAFWAGRITLEEMLHARRMRRRRLYQPLLARRSTVRR
jgi:hypothetical protein